MLPKEKISLKTLNEVLSKVYDTTIDEESSKIFLVDEEIFVHWYEEENRINLFLISFIAPSTSDDFAAKLANRLNNQFTIIKVSYERNGQKGMVFYYRYTIICECGLDISLFLRTLKLYYHIIIKAKNELKESGIEFV